MRSIKILIFAMLLFSATSCVKSTQLGDRAIVEAIGIDKSGGEFTLSVQYYTPNRQENSILVKDSAESISKVISKINSKIGKELYFAHNNVIIIGFGAAENDVKTVLEYFDADTQTKSDVCVFVTENAEKTLSQKNQESNITQSTMLEIILNSSKSGSCFDNRMFAAIEGGISKRSVFSLPYAGIDNSGYFEVYGSCVFKDWEVIELLNKSETRAVVWCKGNVQDYEFEENDVVFRVVRSESSIQALLIENSPFFRINVTVFLNRQDAYREEVETISNKIKGEISTSIEQLVKKQLCDIFNFTGELKAQFPDYFKEYSDLWYEKYPFEYEINVRCIT